VKDEGLPVVVFSGSYSAALVLTSILNGSGIAATLYGPPRLRVSPLSRVVVAKGDVDRAMPLVEEFAKTHVATND
jgi:hypothetical protein